MNRKWIIAGLFVVALVGGYVVAGPRMTESASPKAATKGDDGHGHKEGGHEEEGEIKISDAKVAASAIELVKAGPATLKNALILNGIVQPNQETLVQVTPRFPGVVREIYKRIGDQVKAGELLAKIESNQSLTTYEMRAPTAGTIIDRQVSLGEYASEQKSAFVVADLSSVWIDFSVYRRDMARVRNGDTVLIESDNGGPPIETKISYLAPVGNSDTQSALARAVVPNPEMKLRPGFFDTGNLVLTAKQVSIAVKVEALQSVENKQVVFVRNGEKFETRDVEIGARDPQYAEILFGVAEGDIYAAKNSFIVKAELAKGSASHEH